MQLLGAWMINEPFFRAVFKNWFIRGATSTPLRVAFKQWCKSHISQTITAVSEAFQPSFWYTGWNRTFSSDVGARERFVISKLPLSAAIVKDVENNNKAAKNIFMRIVWNQSVLELKRSSYSSVYTIRRSGLSLKRRQAKSKNSYSCSAGDSSFAFSISAFAATLNWFQTASSLTLRMEVAETNLISKN